MAKKKTRDQIIVRIRMENGVPRVRPLTSEEQEQFTKTHPKSKLPTVSLEQMSRLTDAQDINRMTDPATVRVVSDPSGR